MSTEAWLVLALFVMPGTLALALFAGITIRKLKK